MSAQDYRAELAKAFFAAFLARDPLAQQRFTEIGSRLRTLAGVAFTAAEAFMQVECAWRDHTEAAQASAQHDWDYSSAPAREPPTPARLKGAADLAAKDFAGAA